MTTSSSTTATSWSEGAKSIRFLVYRSLQPTKRILSFPCIVLGTRIQQLVRKHSLPHESWQSHLIITVTHKASVQTKHSWNTGQINRWIDRQVKKCQLLFQKCSRREWQLLIWKFISSLRKEILSCILTVRHFPLGSKPSAWPYLSGGLILLGTR